MDPEVRQALDELHWHFDAHRAQLIRDYKTTEAANAKREKWLREHPPVPKDTTMSFFPIRSVHTRSSR